MAQPENFGADDDLVAAVLARQDERAFAELVRRHQSRIRNWMRQLTRDTAGADDIAQEAFVAAWQKLSTYGGDGKFGAWLMKIAWNEFLMAQRSDRQRRRLSDAVLAEHPEEPSHDTSAAAAAAVDVERLLAGLSDDERVSMLLCYAHGMSHAEASEITGMPIGTVKSHIARAKVRLRDRFQIGATSSEG